MLDFNYPSGEKEQTHTHTRLFLKQERNNNNTRLQHQFFFVSDLFWLHRGPFWPLIQIATHEWAVRKNTRMGIYSSATGGTNRPALVQPNSAARFWGVLLS